MFEEYRLQEQRQIANEQFIVNEILTLKITGEESKLLIEIYHNCHFHHLAKPNGRSCMVSPNPYELKYLFQKMCTLVPN